MPQQKKRSKWVTKLIVRIAVVGVIIACAVSIISIQSNIAEKKVELEMLQGQIDNLEIENEDLSQILNSDDIESYMENIAREEYGYAYPDEYRFYDASRN